MTSRYFLDDALDLNLLKIIFRDIIVTKANFNPARAIYEYEGISEQFEVCESDEIPEYTCEITRDPTTVDSNKYLITWKRKDKST